MWTASWSGHTVTRTKPPSTTLRLLPAAVTGKIIDFLDLKEACKLLPYLSEEDRIALLTERPLLISKMIRHYNDNIDAIPARWKQAIDKTSHLVRSLELHIATPQELCSRMGKQF